MIGSPITDGDHAIGWSIATDHHPNIVNAAYYKEKHLIQCSHITQKGLLVLKLFSLVLDFPRKVFHEISDRSELTQKGENFIR